MNTIPQIDTNSTEDYLSAIMNAPTLSTKEESDLSKRIQRGDQNALTQLVEANERYIVHTAYKYKDSGLSLIDLINAGRIGLSEAAKRYQPLFPESGFFSYAVWWVSHTIQQKLAMRIH